MVAIGSSLSTAHGAFKEVCLQVAVMLMQGLDLSGPCFFIKALR